MQCLHLHFLLTSSLPRAVSKMQKNRGGIAHNFMSATKYKEFMLLPSLIHHSSFILKGRSGHISRTQFLKTQLLMQLMKRQSFSALASTSAYFKRYLQQKNLSLTMHMTYPHPLKHQQTSTRRNPAQNHLTKCKRKDLQVKGKINSNQTSEQYIKKIHNVHLELHGRARPSVSITKEKVWRGQCTGI